MEKRSRSIAASPRGPRSVRALIVDHHVLFAEAVSAALADHGYRIEKLVHSGQEAVAAARAIQPDLVLMELRLPDGYGVEVGRAIARHAPQTRIVAVTAGRDPDLVTRSLRAGFHGFVSKESPMALLVESLDAVMSGGTAAPGGDGERPGAWRPPGPLDSLTPREEEILDLLAQGVLTSEIAARLHIATNTVRSHIQSILSKLGAHSRLEAVAIARRRRVVDPVG